MHALIFLAGCLASILTPFLLYTTISNKLSSAATPAAAEEPFASLGVDGACASSGAVPSALAFWVLLLLMGCVIKAMLVSFAKLCNVLSPHGYDNEPIDCAHAHAEDLTRLLSVCLAHPGGDARDAHGDVDCLVGRQLPCEGREGLEDGADGRQRG